MDVSSRGPKSPFGAALLLASMGIFAISPKARATFNLGAFWKGVYLSFSTSPATTATSGTAFSTQPSVTVKMPGGTVLSSPAFNITLAPYSDSACKIAASGSLGGTTSVSSSAGTASFSGLSYTGSNGTVYLKATSPGAGSVCSTGITISGGTSGVTLDTSYNGGTSSSSGSIAVSTSGANELVLVIATGSLFASASITVSGGGLTWNTLFSNYINSIGYVFWAVAPSQLSSSSITVHNSGAYYMTYGIYTFKGVDTSTPIGSVVTNMNVNSSGTSYSQSLTPKENYSLVVTPYLYSTLNTSSNGIDTGLLSVNSGWSVVNQKDSSWVGGSFTNYDEAALAESNSLSTAGTSVTPTWSWVNSVSGEFVQDIELIASGAVPAIDQVASGDDGTGAATYTVACNATEPNEVLLLGINWMSTTAMTTLPSGGPGNWTSVASVNNNNVSTLQVFRTITGAGTSPGNMNVTVTVPGSVRSNAVCVSFVGANASGTYGSGAVDATSSSSGTTANPSTPITTLTSNDLLVSFLGSQGLNTVTAGAGYTLPTNGTISSSGGGGGTSKSTTAFEYYNSILTSPAPVTATFTESAVNWGQIDIAVKQ